MNMTKEDENKCVGLIGSVMDVQKHALQLVLSGIPENVRTHIRASYREQLLAFRALLDSAIDRLGEDREAARKKPQKVKIE
jgi:hypothetical protein